MKTNKNGVKLLAAIAVFAMMFAAFSILIVSDDSSAEALAGSKDLGDGYSVSFNSGLNVELKDGKYVFTGIAYTSDTTTVTFPNSSDKAFGDAGANYAYATIAFPTSTIWVKQTNSALVQYSNDQNIHQESGTYYKEGKYAFKNNDNTLFFLIPKDSSVVKFEVWADKNDAKGDLVRTILFDFSKVSTKILLDTTSIGDDNKLNSDGWKYTWDSENSKGVLNLKDYNGSEVFTSSKKIEVKLEGTNSITNYGVVKGDSAIITSGALYIDLKTTTAAASLQITADNNNAFGIQSGGAMSIGSTTTAILNLDITGSPNRGIYAIGGLTTEKTTINVIGSEKAIRVGGTGAVTDLTVKAGSTINATLSIPESHNAEGDDDYSGIKTEGKIASIASESIVTTQGLNTTDITNASGKLIVTGDYTQNPNAGTKVPVAGLYLSGSNKVNVNRIDSTTGTVDGKIYIVGDAETYGPVEVTTGTTVTEKVVTDATTITTSFGTADKVTVNGTVSGSSATTITVPKGKELVFTGNVNYANMTIDVKGDVVIPTGVSITAKISNGTNTASLSGVSGQFTISEGSIHMSGNYQGTLNDLKGDLVLSGSTDGNLTINVQSGQTATITFADGFIASDKITITGTAGSVVKVIEGTTMTLNNELELNNIQMNIGGALVGTGSVNAHTNDVKVYVESGAIFAVTPTGNAASFNITDSVKEFHISQDIVSNLTTTSQQKVYIDKSITIYNGATLSIAGDLEVAEGMKITIKEGGKLYINGINAYAHIAGEIVIEGTDGLEFDGKEMVVDGKITVKADNTAAASLPAMKITKGKTVIDGEVTIFAKASANFTEGITITENGTLTINGTITGNVDYNYGLVYINGTVGSSFTVKNQAGGIVDIVSVTGSVSVTDLGMIMKKDEVVGGTSATGATYTANKVTITDAKGLKVTSDFSTKTDNGVKKYTNKVFISGTAVPVKGYESTAAIKTVTGTVIVSETLDIGKVKVLVDGSSKLSVTGTVLSTSTETQGIDGTGTLDVSGLVKSYGALDIDKINAVHYQQKENDVTYDIYTNLADAISSGVSELDVMGNITISKDTTIPKGVSIDASSSDVTVKSEVTFTVADGGELSARKVTVNGTFMIENTEGVSCNNIISDVSATTETTAKYTNIYTALSEAQSGETVKITKKDNGIVCLSKDSVIAEGVTLEVPSEKTLTIIEGVKLTVDGTLYLNNGALKADSKASEAVDITGTFGTVTFVRGSGATPDAYHAVVEVTGAIVSSDAVPYSTYKIPGAYYDIKSKYYITTVEKSAADILKTDDYKVDINGENTVGTVAFIGEDGKEVTVNVNTGKLTAEKMTVSFGKIVFKDTSGSDVTVVTGTFGSSMGAIELDNIMVKDTKTFTVEDKLNADDANIVCIYGDLVPADANKKSSVIISGKVTVAGTSDSSIVLTNAKDDMIISEDAELTIANNLTITNVPMQIYGNTIVDNAKKLTAGTVVVLGTLTVNDKTSTKSAGITDISMILIGGGLDQFSTNGAASVSGDVTATVIKLFPGATVSGIIKEKIESDTILSTEFFVEDNLWMTVYTTSASVAFTNSSGSAVEGYKPVVKEAQFDYWMNIVGDKLTKISNAKNIGASDVKKVYAYIDYTVYDVEVYACEGIDDVYIDGVIMKYIDGVFKSTVKAGEHTISYTLSNGYSGTATMLIDDEKVAGYKFTAGGDFGLGTEYEIKLQGIEKSGYVPESPDVPTPIEPTEKDDSLGITEYLLIVLVVLAAILVVVVAIRMMRS